MIEHIERKIFFSLGRREREKRKKETKMWEKTQLFDLIRYIYVCREKMSSSRLIGFFPKRIIPPREIQLKERIEANEWRISLSRENKRNNQISDRYLFAWFFFLSLSLSLVFFLVSIIFNNRVNLVVSDDDVFVIFCSWQRRKSVWKSKEEKGDVWAGETKEREKGMIVVERERERNDADVRKNAQDFEDYDDD